MEPSLLILRISPYSTYLGPSSAPPQKRGRGRPKGSKNKKGTAALAAPAVPTVPRKRGRPPKVRASGLSHCCLHHNCRSDPRSVHQEKKDTGEEPPPKRPRGRPPKNPKPPAGTSTEGADSTPPVKRKRGRPPKNPQPAPTPGT
jgi:high mobility group AT-hook protein 2